MALKGLDLLPLSVRRKFMDKVPIFKFTGCFYGEWINFTFISAILMYKTASREKKRERERAVQVK